MIIAVDFDGTIVENRYPEIGQELPFAIQTLKMLSEQQHRIILWTVRDGALLDEAVEWCRKRGLEFYAVNRNFPEESNDCACVRRKIDADLFIDDRNVCGIPEWGLIYQMVTEGRPYADILSEQFMSGDFHDTRSSRFRLFCCPRRK